MANQYIGGLLICILSASPVRADLDPQRLAQLNEVVPAALAQGAAPGAVVVVVHGDRVVYRQAFGLQRRLPAEVPLAVDAIFDLASLTKPLATASSILTLVERGKLRVSDRVAEHWPAFADNEKKAITVEQLLLHTSGLTADNALSDYANGTDAALAAIARLPLEAPAGTRFKYSDVGYIVLGHLVERLSGQALDTFARQAVFTPAGMRDTGFRPTASARLVPTTQRDGQWLCGTVHDPRAAALNGVAGHAGLFGSADDLARFARLLLRNGELDGQWVFNPLGVRWLTEARSVPGGLRTYGWDVDTAYSGLRGELFPRGRGLGHTGFTGTSLWLDPPSGTAVIVLTSRLHPDGMGNVTRLRNQVATIVAAAIRA